LEDFDFHYKKHPEIVNVLMLGNSLVRYGGWDSLLHRSDVFNAGISGDKIPCIALRLQYVCKLHPKICFIEGGINDLPAANTDSVYSCFTKIVKELRANGIIPVVNMMVYISPRAGINYPYRKDYLAINKKIDELNQKLQDFAKKNDVMFIDLNRFLSSNSEKMLKEEFTLDGIHLTDLAYQIWAQRILEILSTNKI
jgi:lysophospholipase L1-like esterase